MSESRPLIELGFDRRVENNIDGEIITIFTKGDIVITFISTIDGYDETFEVKVGGVSTLKGGIFDIDRLEQYIKLHTRSETIKNILDGSNK